MRRLRVAVVGPRPGQRLASSSIEKTIGRQRRPGVDTIARPPADRRGALWSIEMTRWACDAARSVIPLLRALGGRPCRTLGHMAVISAAEYVISSALLIEARPSEVDNNFGFWPRSHRKLNVERVSKLLARKVRLKQGDKPSLPETAQTGL